MFYYMGKGRNGMKELRLIIGKFKYGFNYCGGWREKEGLYYCVEILKIIYYFYLLLSMK